LSIADKKKQIGVGRDVIESEDTEHAVKRTPDLP
jgi:hypothetical protein